MGKVNIILADDQKIVRKVVRALLESEPDFEVTGEVESWDETIKLVSRLKPDVLLTGLNMCNVPGREKTKKFKKTSPRTRIIVFSTYDQEAYVKEALKAGAQGYVAKESGAIDLVPAIRAVMKGRIFLSPLLKTVSQSE